MISNNIQSNELPKVNIIKINSLSNIRNKSRSPPKITTDKLIFIKTQMKNDIANFTNYGIKYLINKILGMKDVKQ